MNKRLLFFVCTLLLTATVYSQNNQWTWMKGDSLVFNTDFAVYGTQGVPSVANHPGSRISVASWTDASGNFWIFGGSGYGGDEFSGYLNDLWKYNPATNQWTWINGDKSTGKNGVYGTVGVPAAGNQPGGRIGAVTWTDASGNAWLFGGNGYAEFSYSDYLNDLWKYNPATNQWTWMKGDKTKGSNGIYGTMGTAAAANNPGARQYAVAWKDAANNFWLFAGDGYPETGNDGKLNDLWKYNPANNQWTWVKGNKTRDNNGVYGSQGVSAAANIPGGRRGSTVWRDAANNTWLFGGQGYDASNTFYGSLNDLWKYNATTNQWTWVKGDNSYDHNGIYGTQTVADAANNPGGRHLAFGFTDTGGNLWLIGGNGYPETDFTGYLNDVWKYNTTTNQWTWMKGEKTAYSNSIFGNSGVTGTAYTPGARYGSAGWVDGTGKVWLFGGVGESLLNELWRYDPAINQWAWVREYSSEGYAGIYGSMGVAAANNNPGGRGAVASWKDSQGNFYIFGGIGNGGKNNSGLLNDLWKYNPATNQWTWINGDSTVNNLGIYGTLNTPSPGNKPGARRNAVSWKDANGNFWLFGGSGYGETDNYEAQLNDLWKYDPASNQWTWVRGDKTGYQGGVSGSQGVPDPANNPGAREAATGWLDTNGKLWLFGGYGYTSGGSSGDLNDLWKYDITSNQWTWVKGDNVAWMYGSYDTIPSDFTYPGARHGATGWKDIAGNLFLFGGQGNAEFEYGYLNDVWKYDMQTNQWAWLNGGKTISNESVYGTQGAAAKGNGPGSRSGSSTWTDANGNVWLWGGFGYPDFIYSQGPLNELWKYNPVSNQWAWIKGQQLSQEINGIYGTKGVGAANNNPGRRTESAAFIGNDGKCWLFGGNGYGSNNNYGPLNDLWYIDPCINSLNLSSSANEFCNAEEAITLTAAGAGPYTWYRNGILLPLQTSAVCVTTAPGKYFVKATAGSCELFSNEIFLKPAPIPPGLAGTDIYCYGSGVSVGIAITEADQSYTWLRNGSGVQTVNGNGGNQSLSFSIYNPSVVGTYVVVSYRPGCPIPVYSNEVYVGFAEINNLTISNLCPDKVGFYWDDVAPLALSAFYQYKISYNPDPYGTGVYESNTYYSFTEVPGLIPATSYYIHVRSQCNAGFGEWSTMPFTTPATVSTFSITPETATICQGNSQQLSVNGGSDYQWLLNDQVIFNAGTAVYDATAAGVYKVQVTDGGCRFVVADSVIIEVNPAPAAGTARWTGTVDSDWTKAGNWQCGIIPATTTAVFIDGGKLNYPVISSNLVVKSLSVAAGATIKVNTGVDLKITN